MTELMLPLFAQIGLTFVLLYATAFARVSALRSRKVKLTDIALGQRAWPARTTQISNAFQNQLEVPTLFYAAIVVAIITKSGAMPMVPLAWGFVATRFLHALIHTTGNNVVHRFYAFLAGVVILTVMWIILAHRVLAP